MSTRELEGLVPRLMQILFNIDPDKALAPTALADDFRVTHRTSLHDQNEWLNLRPFEKADGQFRPHSSALGQLTPQDMRQFASMAGGNGLYQGLNSAFLRHLFDGRIGFAWLVKDQHWENHSGGKASYQLFSIFSEKAYVTAHRTNQRTLQSTLSTSLCQRRRRQGGSGGLERQPRRRPTRNRRDGGEAASHSAAF